MPYLIILLIISLLIIPFNTAEQNNKQKNNTTPNLAAELKNCNLNAPSEAGKTEKIEIKVQGKCRLTPGIWTQEAINCETICNSLGGYRIKAVYKIYEKDLTGNDFIDSETEYFYISCDYCSKYFNVEHTFKKALGYLTEEFLEGNRIEVYGKIKCSSQYENYKHEDTCYTNTQNIEIKKDVECTFGACCDLSTHNFKSYNTQPTGYTDYYDCVGTNSATGTNFVRFNDYYCNGNNANKQLKQTKADTCGTCEYCNSGYYKCRPYGPYTKCGTQDCDYRDTTCRNYHDVYKYCNGAGSCSSGNCNSYTNTAKGTYCGTNKECDGNGNCVDKKQCISGACCDLSTHNFKSYNNQPTGYTDYYDCDGTNSATGTNFVRFNDYYCNGNDADEHLKQTKADTCGNCEYCNSGESKCKPYSTSTVCGTWDCDYLDTTCRNYNDVNKYCNGVGWCSSGNCNSYTNTAKGTYCGTNKGCDGNGNCVDKGCSCTSWANIGCGQGSCSSTQMYQTRTCTPSGCGSESQCIDDTSCTTCTNECSSGETRCNGDYLQTCGNYDSDTCLEWPSSTSGNGNDYCANCSCTCGDYGKSSEIGYCSDGKDNDCDGKTDSNDADCISCSCTFWENKGCGEGSCSSEQRLQTRTCIPSGCDSENQCVDDASCKCSCYKNSDCGGDGWINNPTCSNNDVYQYYRTYKCSNPGTAQASCSHKDTNTLKQDCGETTYEKWGSNYCDGNNIKNNRTVHNKGCSDNACFSYESTETETIETCQYGCENGTCNPPPITCSSNSECGTDEWIGNTSCSNNDVYQDYRTHTCNNPGTHTSYCSYQDTNTLKQDCGTSSCSSWNANYCKDNDIYHERICNDKGCSSSLCYDNKRTEETKVQDCGDTTYENWGSNYCDGNNIKNNRTIHKKGCSNNACFSYDTTETETIETCEHICENGVCISPECYKDSDCGTDSWTGKPFCDNKYLYGNYRTYKCNNPGTAKASCSYTETKELRIRCKYGCENGACKSATCSQDSDCGTDKLIGDPICLNNDVYQTYGRYKCDNIGTAKASCSYTETKELKEDCGNTTYGGWSQKYCFKGHVVHFRSINEKGCSSRKCYSNKLFEKETVQNCGTAGCINGACKSPPCSKDSDCGTNKLIGDPICLNNSVYQTWRIYKCSNPRTIQASCSYTNTNTLKQDCGTAGCINGACIEEPIIKCLTNIKGDLNDDNKVDIFDMIIILKVINNNIKSSKNIYCIDIDENKKINIFDLIELLKMLKTTTNQQAVSTILQKELTVKHKKIIKESI